MVWILRNYERMKVMGLLFTDHPV